MLDNSAVAEPLTVRPLVEYVFILVNETLLSVCKIKGPLQTHTPVKGFQKVLEENIRRNRLEFFLSFTV